MYHMATLIQTRAVEIVYNIHEIRTGRLSAH